MKNVYIFSGLGTDERVFKFLEFKNVNVKYIEWQETNAKSLNIYASRLLHQIKSPRPILIGLSFGGIIAIEVAKHIETEKVILISSAKTKKEIPYYYRLAGKLKLHRLLPIKFLKTPNIFSNWFFEAKSKDERKLLSEILKDTSPIFLKWAINQILTWQNSDYSSNIIHIHGTSDRILPIRFIKYDIKIEHGGHFMTINKAKELNIILNDLLI